MGGGGATDTEGVVAGRNAWGRVHTWRHLAVVAIEIQILAVEWLNPNNTYHLKNWRISAKHFKAKFVYILH